MNLVRIRRRGDRFYSLSPVLRGEGWGEGRVDSQSLTSIRSQRVDESSFIDSARTSPLSPALSPEYRGEGVRRKRNRPVTRS